MWPIYFGNESAFKRLLVINTNTSAQRALNNLETNSNELTKALSRLSSGNKIISPSDDSAGLAVSSRLQAETRRGNAVINNLSNANSFASAQEGVLRSVSKSLKRMGELAVLSQDVTKTDSDRSNYSIEFEQLRNDLNSLSNENFNGIDLFKATSNGVTINTDADKVMMQGLDLKFDTNVGNIPITLDSGGAAYNHSVSLSEQTITTTTPATRALEKGTKLYTSSGAVLELTNGVSVGDTTLKVIVSGQDLKGSNNFRLYLNEAPSNQYHNYFQAATGYSSSSSPQTIAIKNTGDNYEMYAGKVFHFDNGAKFTLTEPLTIGNSGSVNLTGILSGGNISTNAKAYSRGKFQDLITGELGISTSSDANKILILLKENITLISKKRAIVGAYQSRIRHESDGMKTYTEKLGSSISRIRDVDVAETSTKFSRQQLLQSMGTQMLTQANILPQSVLKLIG